MEAQCQSENRTYQSQNGTYLFEIGTIQFRECKSSVSSGTIAYYAQVTVNELDRYYDEDNDYAVDIIRERIAELIAKLKINVKFINIRSTFIDTLDGVEYECVGVGYGEPIKCEIVIDTNGEHVIQISYEGVVTHSVMSETTKETKHIGFKWCEHPYLIDVNNGIVSVAINYGRKFGDFTPTVGSALEAGWKYAIENNICVKTVHVNVIC